MLLAPSPVVGTICIEPLAAQDERDCDDASLELVLESFAHRCSLAGEPEVSLVASTRLSRLAALNHPPIGIGANLAQLLDDLRAEYEQVSPRLEC